MRRVCREICEFLGVGVEIEQLLGASSSQW
jgi:hypothetical protein